MYHNISRFQDSGLLIFQDALRFQKMIFRAVLRFHDSFSIIKSYRKNTNIFKHFISSRIHLGFKIIKHLSGFQQFKQFPTILNFPFLFNTIVEENCLGPTSNIFNLFTPTFPTISIFGITQFLLFPGKYIGNSRNNIGNV